MPFSISAPAETFNSSLGLHVFKHPADHINADPGTFPQDVGHAESAGKTIHCLKNQCPLLTSWLRLPAQSFFKLLISALENKTDKVDIMPGVVSSFVPSFRTQLQCLVISFFILLDQAFEADISSHIDAEMIALQKHQQPGYPAVSIAERVDAKKIQVEGRQRYQLRHLRFSDASLPGIHQLLHKVRSFSGRNSPKPDTGGAIQAFFDDVAVFLFVLAGIPRLTAGQTVQVFADIFRNRQL